MLFYLPMLADFGYAAPVSMPTNRAHHLRGVLQSLISEKERESYRSIALTGRCVLP